MYVLWHDAEPIGICVLGFGPLASSARNRFFGIRGPMTPHLARKLNSNFACVSRLVLDPRYRGAGIASAFLRRCCELSPWPWIELVSEMAELVPFCQAAGFKRIGPTASKTAAMSRSACGRGSLDPTAGPWGASNWTQKTFRNYLTRVRFSRPTYFLYDNRRKGANGRGNRRCEASQAGDSNSEKAK